jgi:hypothetical protein
VSLGYCLGFDIYYDEVGCALFSEAVDLDPDSTRTTKTVVVTGILWFVVKRT